MRKAYNLFNDRRVECKMKITENMLNVLGALARCAEGKAFARDLMEDEALKGKTFNAINATLAAAAGKDLCTKAKALREDKILTCYTLTEAGHKAIEKEAE